MGRSDQGDGAVQLSVEFPVAPTGGLALDLAACSPDLGDNRPGTWESAWIDIGGEG